MDMHEIRKQNLRAIMVSRFEGKQALLAAALDRPANYISRCLSTSSVPNNRKNIGEDFAREIESTLGLERYQLDLPSLGADASGPAGPLSQAARSTTATMDALSRVKGKATPRSLSVIRRIEKAAQQGSLKEADLVVLEGIVARFEELNSDPS